MKKRNIIIVSMMILIIIETLVIVIAYQESQRLTIDDITNNMFSQYDHTNKKDKNYEQEFIDECSKYKYVTYSGNLGNTAQERCMFYDKDDNLLFIITFVGNQNLIQVTVDGKTTTYQGK